MDDVASVGTTTALFDQGAIVSKGRDKVVIVGGGVGGLTAAHELAERGFEVHVYERRSYYGGKAASVTIGQETPRSGATRGPNGLPGEHGFRFFPGWYRHLPDTMKRIPYKDKTVHDNLVGADVNLLAAYDRDPVRAVVRLPTTLAELKTVASLPNELIRLGLTVDDMRFFFMKLWQFMTSSEERRIQEFDSQTWWEFMEADSRSQAFRDYLVVSATRNTVAAKPTEASAYTIAKIAIQTLFDTLTPQTLFDRVLNGPTNEVWINPWKDYLQGLGVEFHEDCELDTIELRDNKVTALYFNRSQQAQLARTVADYYERLQSLYSQLRGLVERATNFATLATNSVNPDRPTPDAVVSWCCGTPDFDLADFKTKVAHARTIFQAMEQLRELQAEWPERSEQALSELAHLGTQEDARAFLSRVEKQITDAQNKALPVAAGVLRENERFRVTPVAADYFVFALPVEQMAYYVNRNQTLQRLDPSLNNIILLSDHVDWMAGIQFFLTSTVNITRGHIDLLDSEWALTAISETQFWDDIDTIRQSWDKRVKSILSVDISAWDRKGRFLRKEAYNCNREEIAFEVWSQLKASLNRPGKSPVLSDSMLLGKSPEARLSFYLDDSIIDRFDRKKQAAYDKFRSVRFSAAELLRKQSHRGSATEISFMYGQPLEFNAEPLLVNRVGSMRLRPTAITGISNMFLAADYVRTHTNLATMEGANEAARAAVNGILLASGSKEIPCEIWPLSEPMGMFRMVDEVMFRRGMKFQDTYADIPMRMAAGAASMAGQMAAKAMGKLFNRQK